jgi:hypothetical protein
MSIGFFMTVCTPAGGVEAHLVIHPSGKDDDRYLVAMVVEGVQELFAVNGSGHTQVQDDEVDRLLLKYVHSLPRIRGRQGGVSSLSQYLDHQRAHVTIVVDDEDGLSLAPFYHNPTSITSFLCAQSRWTSECRDGA